MRQKRNAIIAAICVLAVGFAAVSTTLYINGQTTFGVNEDDFKDNVIFTASSSPAVTDTEKGGTSSISADGKTITFATGDLAAIGNTSTLNYDVTNYSTQYDAVAQIECTSTDSNYADYIEVTADPQQKTNFDVTAGKTVSGSLEFKVKKSALGDGNGITISFTCTINANAVERSSANTVTKPAGEKYTLVSDANSDGVADIGDEIQVNNENFYVISNDGSSIAALAKYNLNAGSNYDSTTYESTDIENPTYKQDNTMDGDSTGKLRFASSFGWTVNSDIDISKYAGELNTAISNYKNVVKNASEVRLITLSELQSLGCTTSSCASAPSWVSGLKYWVGTSATSETYEAVTVNSDGSLTLNEDASKPRAGARPVIIIDID